MCDRKPGPRCLGDSQKTTTAAEKRLREALARHAQHLDDPTAQEKVHDAAAKFWISQLEEAGARSGETPPPGQDWWADAGAALHQAHQDQAALMPVAPPKDAPAHVHQAYDRLAEARDDLARRDAIEVADHLAQYGHSSPAAPLHGPRPALWDADYRVSQAERDYHHAIRGNGDLQPGDNWRMLAHEGRMPYDPEEDARHPSPLMHAPWVRTNRPVTPADLPALRRATGQWDHIDWDAQTGRITIYPDPYGEALDRAEFIDQYQQSLWQLGYMTTTEDARIVIHKTPDIRAWRINFAKKRAKRQTARVA